MTKESLRDNWNFEKIHKRIIESFFSIKRENFMEENLIDLAYEDEAFPIGYNQTISQPTTIIHMISLLSPKKEDKILEVGTGSGFNAAVLSKLCSAINCSSISEIAQPVIIH